MIFLLVILIVALLNVAEPWAAIAVIVAVVLEVGEIFALRAWAKRLRRRYKPVSPDEDLVGREGLVVTPCRPEGQVRLRGETWTATCVAGADEGSRVLVESVHELTLVVRPSLTV